MSFQRHAIRVVLIMAFAAGILGWTGGRAPVIWADGLRYISHAQTIDRGAWREAFSRAVDHPMYPLSIAAVHRLTGGDDPASWQLAAQLAAMLSGVLLVIPLYLIALDLFGEHAAWMAALLTFLVPVPGHVFADALSEGTFLLFWCWGIWFALRFLRHGNPAWLLPVVLTSGLAFMTRPEGLLLPSAIVGVLGLMPVLPAIRLSWPRWWIAVSLLVIGPALVAVPYMAMRGGIGTKPAVARLFGLAPKSASMAVERDRPVDDDQSAATTCSLAIRAMSRAIAQSATLPLLALAPFGVIAARRRGSPRSLVLIGLIILGWSLALVRLHATGGYCTPRHALIAAIPLIAAGGAGAAWLLQIAFERLEHAKRLAADTRFRLETVAPILGLLALGLWWSPETLAPLNRGFLGYRQAGEWLASHSPEGTKVFDLKGWALFYSEHPGYSFARIGEAGDPAVRWVVTHDGFLKGPWFYCEMTRNMVQGRRPVRSFPDFTERGMTKVHIYDLSSPPPPKDLAARPLPGRETR